MKLRDYQQEALDDCLKFLNTPGAKPGVVVAPVAYGKSLLISSVAHQSGRKCMVLQPSGELLGQNLDKLRALGGDASVYSAGQGVKEIGELTYATLGSVVKIGKELREYGIDVLLIDECDNSYSEQAGSQFRRLLDVLKPKHVIGFTATPFRLKAGLFGSTLSMINRIRPKVFHNFIHIFQVSEIINRGYWTPIKYKAYEFDEKMMIKNSTGADFTEDSIREYNKVKGINNKIYVEVKELLAKGYTSILLFCDSVETAEKFASVLPNAGFIHGGMNKKERSSTLSNFKSGALKVLANHSILTTGYDHPELQVIIMGRATGSFSLWYQINGRIVRKHESKKEGLFIDYGGNVKRFGGIDSIEITNHPINGWSLFSGDKLLTGYVLTDTPICKSDLDKQLPKTIVVSEYEFNFGAHKGKKLHEVPRNYLEWLCSDKFESKAQWMTQVKKTCKKYLEESKLEQLV
jgi:DNA repair protein RadD